MSDAGDLRPVGRRAVVLIRPLEERDLAAYAELRRRALTEEPLAFAASPETDVTVQIGQAPDWMLFGAFDSESAGAVGVSPPEIVLPGVPGSQPGTPRRAESPSLQSEPARRDEARLSTATIVGSVGLIRSRHPKASHKMHLWGMYVLPGHRRRGIAAHLLDAAIAHARSVTGVEWIELGVTDAAMDARRMYARAGFITWGVEPDALRFDGRAVGEEHMALRVR